MMENIETSENQENKLPALLPTVEENEDFIFETDSYALQNNKDYQNLLKTLVKLQAQRIYVVQALEELHAARESALKDPLAFVEALQKGEVHFRPRIKVAQIPDIDMSKYDVSSYFQTFRPNTRRSSKGNGATSESLKSSEGSSEKKAASLKTEKQRSETYNIPWTAEEQRKLEELLIKYPDEPISSKRWAKISKELGTRSLMQVQSRVQKYFIALKKEGLPVPGRDPKAGLLRNTARKRSYCCQQPSSRKFMRAFDFEEPTSASEVINLAAEENCTAVDRVGVDISTDVSDEDDLEEEFKKTFEYRRLLALKRAKKLKLREMRTKQVFHPGFKCNCCGCNPIRGTRWRCTDCPQKPGVDLCDECADRQYENEEHSPSHVLRPLRNLNLRDTVQTYLDRGR